MLASELKTAFSGVLSFPVTPFTSDLALDVFGFRKNLARSCDAEFAAHFIGCGSGEFHALSMSEYGQLLGAAREVFGQQTPWFAGVGMGLPAALQQIALVNRSGAAGVLVMPPYLVSPDAAGLAEYYRQIALSTDLAVVLYQRGNAVFSLDLLRSLESVPNVVGVKDGTGNLERFRQFTAHFGDRFAWISGAPTAEMTYEAYHACGATAFSSAIANFAPAAAFEFYRATLRGDHVGCTDILNKLVIPLCQIRMRKEGYAVALVKAAMNLMGLAAGPVRPPLENLDEQSVRDLTMVLLRNELLPELTTLTP